MNKNLQIERPTENWTKTPNILLDNMKHFSATEFFILMFMVRKNLGYQAPNKKFSIRYLAACLNLGKSTIARALSSLLKKNVLKIISGGEHVIRQFEINWKDPDFPESINNFESCPTSGTGNNSELSHQRDTTVPFQVLMKENILKENSKSSAKAEISPEGDNKQGQALLNNSGVDTNIKKKKKRKGNIKYKDLTELCLKSLFIKVKAKSPGVKEKQFFSEEEKLLCQEIIGHYIQGIPDPSYSALRGWGEDITGLVSGIGTEQGFLSIFRQACNIYRCEYYPESKKLLPNRLSTFLYNGFAKVKSCFWFYGCLNMPRSINGSEIIKDETPDLTTEYLKFFNDKVLTDRDKNDLVRYIKELLTEHEAINKQSIIKSGVKVFREDSAGPVYLTEFFMIKNFVSHHIEFLSNFEYGPEFSKELYQIRPSGWFWKKFQDYYNTVYGIRFYKK